MGGGRLSDLPTPLVPPEVDLRDFQGMWVDTDRLLRSDTWMLGNSDEKAAAFTLWAESWHQVPAASLPSNDRMLAKLSQAEKWKTSREHALRGWVHCSDGRLYHPVVAEKALEAWIKKLASAISGAIGNSKRWQVEVDTEPQRQQFRAAVECLRALNPTSRALKEKAVALILAGSRPESPPQSPPESQPESGGDPQKASGGDRKGPDQTRPSISEANASGASAPPPSERDMVFANGVTLLTAAGVSDRNARSFLAAQCKAHGEGAVLAALQRCASERPIQPVPWLQAALKTAPAAPARGTSQAQKSFRERDLEVRSAEAAAWMGSFAPATSTPEKGDVFDMTGGTDAPRLAHG